MPDSDGYPTETELQAVDEFVGTPLQFIDYIQTIWWHDAYTTEPDVDDLHNKPIRRWRISTVGWSGNEEIISHISKTMFHFFYWQQATRGGHYEYRVPEWAWNYSLFLGTPTAARALHGKAAK